MAFNEEIDGFLRDVVERRRGTELDSLIEYEAFSGRAEGKSKHTIELTIGALTRLKRYLVENHQSTDMSTINAGILRSFILHLQDSKRFEHHPHTPCQVSKLSGHTINCYIRTIRAAFNRWVYEGFIETSPFEKVRVPKAPRRVIPTFTEEQIHKLLSVIDTSTPVGFRDHCLILVYLDTACRLTEITRLNVADVDLNGGQLKVLGKGNKERIVPIGVTVRRLLWKYLRMYRPEPAVARHDCLFLTRDGRPLSKNRVETIIKTYGKRAGINGVRCSPHTIRHTACKQWIVNGGDIFSLQRITGHSSLEVLRGYIDLAQGDIQSAHRRYSAIDNLDLPTLKARKNRRT